MPDLLICTDCLMWYANGDTSGMDSETEEAVKEHASLTDEEAAAVVPDSGESPEPGFMWRPCDACGSRLAGDRHVAWIIEK